MNRISLSTANETKTLEKEIDKTFLWPTLFQQVGSPVLFLDLLDNQQKAELVYLWEQATMNWIDRQSNSEKRELEKMGRSVLSHAHRNQTTVSFFQMGIEYEQHQEYDEALFWFQKIKQPNAEVHFHIGVCQKHLKQHQDAFLTFSKGASKRDKQCLIQLAECYKLGIGTEKNIELMLKTYHALITLFNEETTTSKASYEMIGWLRTCIPYLTDETLIDEYKRHLQDEEFNAHYLSTWGH